MSVELRPYQAEDVERLAEVPACLVAYDKRGGKTVTALALVREWGAVGPVLIVSDKTSQWSRDVELMGMPPDTLHLVDRPKRTRFRRELAAPIDGHLYQIHWAGLVPEFAALANVRWSAIIADEAHAAKNRKAQRTRALKKLRTRHRIGLTADPSDNAPQDIWSLLNWLYPDRYPSFWRWVRRYVEVERGHGRNGDYLTFGEPINVEEFRAEIAPFFTRLRLDEIDPGQVPETFVERAVDMTPEQASAYRSMVEWQLMTLGDELVIAEYPMIEAMRLQQLAQAMGEAQTRTVWRTVTEDDPINGGKRRVRRQVETTTVHQREPSPKLDALTAELLDERCGPAIVFTQFRDMVTLAAARLAAAGLRYVVVTADDQIITAEAAFQRGEVDVIVGTVWRLSESIELSRAETVVFLDCPWNPRVRGQAIGRAHAVGKRTPVRVVDVRTRGTVDYARLDRVRTKQEWRDALLGDAHTLDGGCSVGGCP